MNCLLPSSFTPPRPTAMICFAMAGSLHALSGRSKGDRCAPRTPAQDRRNARAQGHVTVCPFTVGTASEPHATRHGDGQVQPVTAHPVDGQATLQSPPPQSTSQSCPAEHSTLQAEAPVQSMLQLDPAPQATLHPDVPGHATSQVCAAPQFTLQSWASTQPTSQSSACPHCTLQSCPSTHPASHPVASRQSTLQAVLPLHSAAHGSVSSQTHWLFSHGSAASAPSAPLSPQPIDETKSSAATATFRSMGRSLRALARIRIGIVVIPARPRLP